MQLPLSFASWRRLLGHSCLAGARLCTFALAFVLLASIAHADDGAFFADTQSVGQDLLRYLLWVSGLGAVLGFVMAGHAFTSGDVERGKVMLKGTVIGSVCIYGAVGLVHFISSKFSETTF